ncbi:alpha/beta fold hydrolase [Streptomyces sp. CA-250714]|uniref:alpha/beta fold hydrolase n=1 Tax=Streptomyces sp. CA-250714 TaxID=3240060 RepID=UPI003D8D87EE
MTLLHHRLDGPADGRPLILGPSLGTSFAVWEPQLAASVRHHRVLRYDLPGHGGSPTSVLADPAPGRTTVEELAGQVLALADHHGWPSFRYAGISLGGAIGTYLAVHRPERVDSLALVCSSARFGEPEGWRERAALVRGEGTRALLDQTPGRWFADPATTAASGTGSRLLADLAAVDSAGYAACCDALSTLDLRAELHRVTAPTLVVAGLQDPATPPPHAHELAEGIPGASLVELSGAAHLAGVERSDAVTAALLAHWGRADGGTHGGIHGGIHGGTDEGEIRV